MINRLEHTSDIGTISNMKLGRDIHRGYRANMINKGKEWHPKGSKLRIDFVNHSRNIIYELKPNNYKSAIQGIKQLKNYNTLMGGNYRLVLVLY